MHSVLRHGRQLDSPATPLHSWPHSSVNPQMKNGPVSLSLFTCSTIDIDLLSLILFLMFFNLIIMVQFAFAFK